MKRLIFRSVAKLTEDPVDVFWLAGFVLNERNEWKIRVVYRNMRTGKLNPVLEPIGLLPIISLGMWFDHGVLQADGSFGEIQELVIPNVAKPEIITSADIPEMLYQLPQGRAGRQRLFRYRTAQGTVLVPAVELVRALFIHSRALALALMRPAGLDQLFAPMAPGRRKSALIRFTREMAKSTLNRALVMEFAWIVLDRGARRSWDSVRRLSAGQECILFEPPTIRNSIWRFRGVKHDDQYFVLELLSVGGRYAPVRRLKYSHPGLKRVVTTRPQSERSDESLREDGSADQCDEEIDVDDGEEGSGSYRSAQVVSTIPRISRFENKVSVFKRGRVTYRQEGAGSTGQRRHPQSHRTIRVTTGERASAATLKPMEFRLLANVSSTRMGDLEALDETVRHMRDKLPLVVFSMGLVQLTLDKAAAYVGSARRVAMVVRVNAPGRPPIVMIDIERTGIVALSLMALHFSWSISEDRIEDAIRETLDGWVNAGGHWSADVEVRLRSVCHSDRIPKAMTPRAGFEKLAEVWAHRLMDRFGLGVSGEQSIRGGRPRPIGPRA